MYSYAKMLESCKAYKYNDVIAMLENNIREEAAKKNKTSSTLTIIKNMIKYSNNYNNRFGKCHIDGDNHYFIDGYRIFKTADNLGYPDAAPEETFKNLNKFFTDTEKEITETIHFSKKEIQTYIKIDGLKRSRPDKPFLILSGSGKIYGFNPFYLLDYIDFTGEESALAVKPNAPIMDIKKTCLVLPVNCRDVDINKYYSWRDRVFGENNIQDTKTA